MNRKLMWSCRHLGHSDAIDYVKDASNYNLHTAVANVTCVGNETNLQDCQSLPVAKDQQCRYGERTGHLQR